MSLSRGKYKVTVDCWENQRFKPLQGWNKPYGDVTPPFSDASGTRTVEYTTINSSLVPVCALPNGWEYANDWVIDRSERYGGIDDQGWSYATSFETLFENTLRSKSEGEMGRMSLVRRRRWTRVRSAESPAATALFEKKVQYANALRYQLEKILQSKEADFAALEASHKGKVKQLGPVVKYAARGLSDTVTVLGAVSKKLLMVRSYLVERGTLEAQHAERLLALGRRWQASGSVPPELQKLFIPPAPESTGFATPTAPSPPPSLPPAQAPGFFSTVCAGDSRQGEKMLSYSSMLTEFLPQDVDSVLEKLRSIVADCQHEGAELAVEVATGQSRLEAAFTSCQHALFVSRKDCVERLANLSTLLTNVSASKSIDDDADLSKIQFNAVYDEDPSRLVSDMGPSPTMASTFGSSYAPRMENSSSNKGVDMSQVDLFVAMKYYHSCAIKADSAVTMYSAFTKQQRKDARSSIARVQALLQATLKVFSHEQKRMWEELVHDLSEVLQLQQVQQKQLIAGISAGGSSSDWKEGLPPSTAAAITASQIEEEEYSALCNPAFPAVSATRMYAHQGRICVAVSTLDSGQAGSSYRERSSSSSSTSSTASSRERSTSSTGRSIGSGIGNLEEVNLSHYYVNLQKYLTIPGMHSKASDYRWLPVTAVVTYDGNFLLYENFANDNDSLETSGQDSSSAASTRRLSQKWFHSDALLRTNLSGAAVQPLLTLGMDAFVVNVNSANLNDRNARSTQTAKAVTIALLSSSSEDARKWMAAMLHPIADSETEAPPRYSNE